MKPFCYRTMKEWEFFSKRESVPVRTFSIALPSRGKRWSPSSWWGRSSWGRPRCRMARRGNSPEVATRWSPVRAQCCRLARYLNRGKNLTRRIQTLELLNHTIIIPKAVAAGDSARTRSVRSNPLSSSGMGADNPTRTPNMFPTTIIPQKRAIWKDEGQGIRLFFYSNTFLWLLTEKGGLLYFFCRSAIFTR